MATARVAALVVNEAQHAAAPMRLLFIYAAGTALGAATTGGVLGLLGVVVPIDPRAAAIALSCIAVALLTYDLLPGKAHALSIPRQTCSTWHRRFGNRKAFFFWGVDLGLGFTTYRVTPLYWLLCSVAVLLLPVWSVPLVMVFYGVGLTVGLAASIWTERSQPDATLAVRPYMLAATARRASRPIFVLLTLSVVLSVFAS